MLSQGTVMDQSADMVRVTTLNTVSAAKAFLPNVCVQYLSTDLKLPHTIS